MIALEHMEREAHRGMLAPGLEGWAFDAWIAEGAEGGDGNGQGLFGGVLQGLEDLDIGLERGIEQGGHFGVAEGSVGDSVSTLEGGDKRGLRQVMNGLARGRELGRGAGGDEEVDGERRVLPAHGARKLEPDGGPEAVAEDGVGDVGQGEDGVFEGGDELVDAAVGFFAQAHAAAWELDAEDFDIGPEGACPFMKDGGISACVREANPSHAGLGNGARDQEPAGVARHGSYRRL